MNHKLIITYIISLLLSSCLAHRQGMFLSPFNSLSNPYHTIPFRSDSLKSAVYASILYSAGTANDKGWDWIHATQANIYRSHNLGIIQAYYGASISIGNYGVSDFYNSNYSPGVPNFSGADLPIDTFYHIPASKYFFGSYSLSAGINGVKTLGNKEWRFLGLEITLQKEFGNYYRFRHSLPDSAANIIFKNNLSGTIGIYTDALWKNRKNTQFGFKFSLYMLINPQSNYTALNTYSIFPIAYFSMTYHVTVRQFTGFMQVNFGTKAASFQIGTSFRITK